jgi:hypothetical protein
MHFPARIAGGKSFLEATIPAPFESPRNGNIRRDVMMLNREGENSKIGSKKGQEEWVCSRNIAILAGLRTYSIRFQDLTGRMEAIE